MCAVGVFLVGRATFLMRLAVSAPWAENSISSLQECNIELELLVGM